MKYQLKCNEISKNIIYLPEFLIEIHEYLIYQEYIKTYPQIF